MSVRYFLFTILFFIGLSLRAESTVTEDTTSCRKNLVDMERRPRHSQQAQNLCDKAPNDVVSMLKYHITEYLCLVYSDLECLKKISAFKATRLNANDPRNIELEFERIVGSKYVNSWLKGDPNKSYKHPGLKGLSYIDSQILNTSSGLEAFSSIAQMASNLVPYGKVLDVAASSLGLFGDFGQSQGPDPSNTYCGPAQSNYINAKPQGRSCIPDYNFNSYAVDSFLEQDKENQGKALKCPDTCMYYANLMNRMAIANASIRQSAMPVFDKTPECSAGGKAQFSFSSVSPESPALMDPSSGRAQSPMKWNGVVVETAQKNGKAYVLPVHYSQSENPRSEKMIKWNVTVDLLMRQQVSATVDPSYMDGVTKLSMHIKDDNVRSRPGSLDQEQGRLPGGEVTQFTNGALSSPSLAIQDRSRYQPQPLHQSNDPALQGMGLAAAEVAGCCSVGEPNRSRCLDFLPTVDGLMSRKDFNQMFPKEVEK